MNQINKKKYLVILTLTLVISFLAIRSEIISALAVDESQGELFSGTGILAILLYSFLALVELTSLIALPWLGDIVDRAISKLRMRGLLWLIPAWVLIVSAWVYLYSPWRYILAGTWTQITFAVGFAILTSALLSPDRIRMLGWREMALAVTVFLLPMLVSDIRIISASSFISRSTLLLGLAFVIALVVAFYHPWGERLTARLLSLRERIGRSRWSIIVLFWLSPILFHYIVGTRIASQFDGLRCSVLFLSVCVTAFLFCKQRDRLVSLDSWFVNLGVIVLFTTVDDYLFLVNNYPFGWYWSEGNRFYDYSLVFGQSLYNYQHKIINPYGYLGRYGLWGVVFLFGNLPIWVHRLWNLFLQIVPPLLFSLLLTRKIEPAGLRYRIWLWIGIFFIVLAPLHPPFMIASIIIALTAFDKSPINRGLSVLIAGYYVAISRFTWAFAPAAMGALIDLFLYYPQRTGNWFRRLLPAIILAVLGMAPGLYLNYVMFQTTIQGESLTAQQPLLWYRLLPNTTLGPGVFLLALIYTGPLLVFIGWWMYTKQWKLDFWQKFAALGALTVFFIGGLVISTKIGGGGDLHNLDMYLVTLMLVVVIGLMQISKGIDKIQLPVWAVSLIMLLILLPVHPYIPQNSITTENMESGYPDEVVVQDALSTIQQEVATASQRGEVLFMDQRQLLTFGYVPAIPFVPEYEKKYMMDQAMANNASYFKPYYRDLANKRFTLIVTEILRSTLKSDMGGPFSEENDAFVTWVSNPTLCFYEPIFVSKKTNIMLLVPQLHPTNCESYLE